MNDEPRPSVAGRCGTSTCINPMGGTVSTGPNGGTVSIPGDSNGGTVSTGPKGGTVSIAAEGDAGDVECGGSVVTSNSASGAESAGTESDGNGILVLGVGVASAAVLEVVAGWSICWDRSLDNEAMIGRSIPKSIDPLLVALRYRPAPDELGGSGRKELARERACGDEPAPGDPGRDRAVTAPQLDRGSSDWIMAVSVSRSRKLGLG